MQALRGTRAASSVTAANSQLARSPSSLTRMNTTVCPAMRTSSLHAAHAVKRSVKLSNNCQNCEVHSQRNHAGHISRINPGSAGTCMRIDFRSELKGSPRDL